jgi:ribosome-associated protein
MADSGRKKARSRSSGKQSSGAAKPGTRKSAPTSAAPDSIETETSQPTDRSPRSSTSPAEVESLAQRAAAICVEYKANDVVLMDLRTVSDMTDFFVVASGTSDTHVRAIGEHVMEEMKAVGARAHHIEGLTQGRWVLLDFVDFVVHLFHPTLREFYQLERLWSDAELVPVAAQGAGA